MSVKAFLDGLAESLLELEKYEHCMSLIVSEDGKYVDLRLDTSQNTYGDWIEGEGGDIGLIRDTETGRVAGVHLPLYNRKLAVFHDGPLRINDGFLKEPGTVDKSCGMDRLTYCFALWFVTASVIVLVLPASPWRIAAAVVGGASAAIVAYYRRK